jgi:hypothetical protein
LLQAASPLGRALGQRLAYVGRSQREAPGVDGLVYLSGEHAIGEFVPATIAGHTDFDRIADPVAG